jgi:hypothetical protein
MRDGFVSELFHNRTYEKAPPLVSQPSSRRHRPMLSQIHRKKPRVDRCRAGSEDVRSHMMTRYLVLVTAAAGCSRGGGDLRGSGNDQKTGACPAVLRLLVGHPGSDQLSLIALRLGRFRNGTSVDWRAPALRPQARALQKQNRHDDRERHGNDYRPVLPWKAAADQEQNSQKGN